MKSQHKISQVSKLDEANKLLEICATQNRMMKDTLISIQVHKDTPIRISALIGQLFSLPMFKLEDEMKKKFTDIKM